MSDFFGRCKICKKDVPMQRMDTDPKNAIGAYISWCPDCEDKADDYFDITSYIYGERKTSVSKNKDQLQLFNEAEREME